VSCPMRYWPLAGFGTNVGREPLCKFLGKPIPDVPFPHGNGLKAFKATFNGYTTQRLKETTRNVLLIGGGLGIALAYFCYEEKLCYFKTLDLEVQ